MTINDSIGCAIPDILFPKNGTNLEKWAVIACDQFTSEPEYWQSVEQNVGNAPSTLRLVLPEVYLGSDEETTRLKDIASSIDRYMSDGTLETLPEGYMLIDRETSIHSSRKGLIIALDLEAYSFEPGNKNLCRATEGTVLSRIPPRVKIRANAGIELPHIMLLIDDPEDTVIGAAMDKCRASGTAPLYDTDLMMESGHISGTFVKKGTVIADGITSALDKLHKSSPDGLLFLVGDGNHSLASAKVHWQNIKATLNEDERRNHPARYALAEVVNIHDKGLDFEPIHRVVFGMNQNDFIAGALSFYKDNGITVDSKADDSAQNFTVTGDGDDMFVNLGNAPHSLPVGSVQLYIDSLVDSNPDITVDYIHGEEAVRSLGKGRNCGVLLPAISKNTFFATVSREGVFPRKTFSMGEAFEKRFYMEAKRIK